MINSKGKNSLKRTRLIYYLLGCILLLAGDGGLLWWYLDSPQFGSLIFWLVIVYSLIIIFFVVLRGVFLNKGSGYQLIDGLLTIKDGYPFQKEIIFRVKDIQQVKIIKAKGFFKFNLNHMLIYVSEKKYILKNIEDEQLQNLKKDIENYEI